MPSLITPLLEQARTAVDDRQLERALALLLRAWKAVRNPALAELVEQLSALLAATRPPLAGSTRSELEASWRERAESADAIELGVLLPSLADADSYQARRRLKLIAGHAPDPRIASTLSSIVLQPPFTAGSTDKFWQTLHELLCACPDPRALAWLEAAPALDPKAPTTHERLDARRRRTVASLRTQLEGMAIGLDVDDLERVEQLGAALADAEAASRDLGPELLAAIVEAPGVVERRAVYADYLLSIGDARGEFIALQLAEGRGELDRAGKARVKALWKEHHSAWLGAIGRVLVRQHTVFRNGFLSVARIKHNHRGLARLLDDPIWATVETLEHAPLALVVAPIMRSLRSLCWTSYQLLAASREHATLSGITELRVLVEWNPEVGVDPQHRVALEDPELFPDLRSLTLEIHTPMHCEQLAWLWSGPLGERLHELALELGGTGPGLTHYLRSLRHARASERGLARLHVEDELLGCQFERSGASWSRAVLDVPSYVSSEAVWEEERALRDVDDLVVDL